MSVGGGSDRIKKTKAEKERIRIGKEQWNDYKSRFVPVENEQIEEVMSWDSQKDMRQAIGDAQSTITRGMPAVTPGGGGVNPAGGGFYSRSMERGQDRGRLSGAGAAEAALSAENKYLAGVSKLIGFGKGIQDSSTTGLDRRATLEGNAAARDSRRKSIENANTMRGYGDIAGAATMFGVNAYNDGWFKPNPAPPQPIASSAGLRPGNWQA